MNKRNVMLFAVVSAAVLVYVNSLWNGFAYDDNWIIQRNTRVHDLGNLAGIWLTPYWPSFGSELGLYRPLTIFSYAIQWAISGGAPWLFHLVNILLHAGVCVLVFAFIERLFSERAHFCFQQSVRVAEVFALERVRADQLGQAIGLMRRRLFDWPHLDERDLMATLSQLPCSLTSRESATYN